MSVRPTTAFDRDQFQKRLQQHQPDSTSWNRGRIRRRERWWRCLCFFTPYNCWSGMTVYLSVTFLLCCRSIPRTYFWPMGSIPCYSCSNLLLASCRSTRYPVPNTTSTPTSIYNNLFLLRYQTHIPSTGMSGPDFYRLKRLGAATSSKLGAVDDVKEKEPERDASLDRQVSPYQRYRGRS